MPSKFTTRVRSRSKLVQTLTKFVATKLAILLQQPASGGKMLAHQSFRMSLHGPGRGRKYLNSEERQRFLAVVSGAPTDIRLFCLMLMWTGGRVSETLALTPASVDLGSGVAALETLKRRRRGMIRQVPLPDALLRDLAMAFDLRNAQCHPLRANRRLWSWSRATAWRRVKAVMQVAEIPNSAAMPKGLRHTFGVIAFQSAPPHIVQRWLGHASLRTTVIYGDVSGPEERAFAARMWAA